MSDKTTVPLDEILWAIKLIVEDRGKGIWEPQMPTMFSIWAANRERADTNETTRHHYADCPHADACARDNCYWRCMDAPENQPTKSDTAWNLQRDIATNYYLALARHYQNQGTCDCGKTTAYNCFVGGDCPIAKAMGESAAWKPYHE